MRRSNLLLMGFLGIAGLLPAYASRIIDVGAAVVTGGAIVAGGVGGAIVGGTAGSIVPGAGTVTGAVVGGGGGAVAAGAVSGAVEYATVWFCSWFDPPDTANFALHADPELLLAPFTPSPTWAPDLNASASNLIHSVSALVQTTKASEETADRLAGAMLVGSAIDIEHQQQWAAEYRAQASERANQVALDLAAYGQLLAAYFPDFANIWFTTETLKAVRDFEAAGNLDYFGQQAADAWQLTPAQRAQFAQGMAGMSDSAIDALGPMTNGEALLGAGVACEECASYAPEANSGLLLVLGSPLALLILTRLSRQKR